jgi:hypothetical protein
LLALVATLAVVASLWHQRMINDRVDKLRTVVQWAMGIANSLQDRIVAQKLTQDQAMAELREQFHRMRFDRGEEYLTAQTADGVTLIHGTLPDREGKASTITDAKGTRLLDLIRDALRNGDSGVVAYRFPKPRADGGRGEGGVRGALRAVEHHLPGRRLCGRSGCRVSSRYGTAGWDRRADLATDAFGCLAGQPRHKRRPLGAHHGDGSLGER